MARTATRTTEELIAAQMRRSRQLRAYAIAVLAGVVVLLFVVVVTRKSVHRVTTLADVRGRADAQQAFAHLPQSGQMLGTADAPVTVREIADLQSPLAAGFEQAALPKLVHDFVAGGSAKLEFDPSVRLGTDSRLAARALLAAAAQNDAWRFADVFLRNQEVEGSGYVTSKYLDLIAEGAGLDVAAFDHARLDRATAFDRSIDGADAPATHATDDATPVFVVTGPHGSKTVTTPTEPNVAAAIRAVR